MNNNTIAIVNRFGEKAELSEVKLNAVREVIASWLSNLFNRKHTINSVYTDTEMELVMDRIGSAAVITGMKMQQGKHYCFSAASITDSELNLLF